MVEKPSFSAQIQAIGVAKVAKACGVSVQAVHKWMNREKLPSTAYTGEKNYAEVLAGLAGNAPSDWLQPVRQAA